MLKKLSAAVLSAVMFCSIVPVYAGQIVMPDFTDVKPNDWFYKDIAFVNSMSYMNGYGDGRFGPNDLIKRGAFAKTLYSYFYFKADHTVPDTAPVFSDLQDSYYTVPALWAWSHGILTGYQDGRFGGEDPLTREQLITCLHRAAKAFNPNISAVPSASLDAFPDKNQVSSFAVDAMKWGASHGIIGSNGRLNPKGTATRAETAKMIRQYDDIERFSRFS